MKLANNERGMVSVLLVALVVLLVVVAGVAAYNIHQAHVSKPVAKTSSPTPTVTTATPTPSSAPTPSVTPTPVPGSDTALILTAASTQCKTASNISTGATLDNTPDIIGGAAQVGVHCSGTQGGYSDLLSKINGTWTIVSTDQQPPSKAICEKYSLPASWCQTN